MIFGFVSWLGSGVQAQPTKAPKKIKQTVFNRFPIEALILLEAGESSMGKDHPASSSSASTLWASVLVLVSSLLFWKLRILDRGTDPKVEIGPIDLYIEHTPMAQFAYEELARGHLPLWNPYQFCGQPFLAIPHVALFYPLHLYSLFVDAVTSVEISFVLHMFLGGIGMALLTRRFGLTKLGTASATITFMWSGWVVFNNVLPGVFACMNWLPLTIFLIDRALDRVRFAHCALIASIACQFLIGATEVLVHTLYVGAAFTLFRLLSMLRSESIRHLTLRGLFVLGSIVAGFLLAAPQLLPSIELVGESARGSAGLSFREAVFAGMRPLDFLHDAMASRGYVAVGILPILAIPLVLGARRQRFVWLFALMLVALAALLVTSQTAYRLYYSLPIVGDLFRRPTKFLDIYAFGQALMAGLALDRIREWASWPRAELWHEPAWILCLGIAGASLGWTLFSLDALSIFWFGGFALLLLFGGVRESVWRERLIVGLLAVQASSLFFQVGGTHIRPVKRPEIYHTHDALLESLRARAGAERIYLSSRFFARPGLTPKQGTLSRIRVSTDYEPLLTERYERFFLSISPMPHRGLMDQPSGSYRLRADSNWTLVDLTATRYFVMSPAEPAAAYMRNPRSGFRLLSAQGRVQVFERPMALPRAYAVGEARYFLEPDEVLAVLTGPGFDPRRQVLLEGPGSDRSSETLALEEASVEIVVDEAEEVVVSVSMSAAGFLVLSDLYYPGWRAFIDDREVEIQRANYLFRAVELETGRSRIRFVYEPASYRVGLIVSGLTLIFLTIGFVWKYRRADPPRAMNRRVTAGT